MQDGKSRDLWRQPKKFAVAAILNFSPLRILFLSILRLLTS